MSSGEAYLRFGGLLPLARAWRMLAALSFRRLLWSVNTLMVLFPLAGCVLFLLVWRNWLLQRTAEDFSRAFDIFSEFFVIVLYGSFITPICALAYATTSIGGDREDRTLLFLLVRPVPRSLILLGKLAATLPLALGLVLGVYFVCCRLAGPVGQLAFTRYAAALAWMTLAYVGLFHLFAVWFRHSTIVAVVYALFMELFLGSMPGIVKRLAINYYGRSLMYAAGEADGLRPPDPAWFELLPPATAVWALWGIAACSVLVALVVFQRREYRDLT